MEAWKNGSNSVRQNNGSLLDLSTEVSKLERQQHAEYLRLKAQSDQIQSNIQSAQLVLSKANKLQGNQHINHLVTRLNSLRGEMLQITSSLKQEVAAKLLEMKKVLTTFNYDFFIARLKDRAISQVSDTTSSTYAATAQFIKAEVLGGPIVREI